MINQKSIKKQDKTFELIKSMTKSEKRFFKIYSTRHVIGDENNYVLLFDAIEKQKYYDEIAIKEKFEGEKFVNRLPVAKAYLYDLILKSMNAYHQQNSIESQLYDYLKNIQFLFNKNLLLQAESLLEKCEKLAKDYDCLEILPEVFRWKKKLLEARNYNLSFKELKELSLNEVKSIDQLEMVNKFWTLQSKLYIQHNNKGIVKQQKELKDIDGVFNERFMQIEDRLLPFRAQMLKNKIYATYFFQIRDFQSSYQYIKTMVDILENNDKKTDNLEREYINAINNLLNITHSLNKKEEFTTYLAKLRKMYRNVSDFKTDYVHCRIIESFHYHNMNFLLKEGLFDEGVAHLKIMEKDILKFNGKLDVSGKAMLYFFAFHISFSAEKYEKAEHWLNKILEIGDESSRTDINHFANILMPIVQFEIGDATALKKHIKKTYAYLLEVENKSNFDKLVVQMLKQIEDCSENEMKQWFYQVKDALAKFTSDPYEERVFAYFQFKDWINCKIENKNYGLEVTKGEKMFN